MLAQQELMARTVGRPLCTGERWLRRRVAFIFCLHSYVPVSCEWPATTFTEDLSKDSESNFEKAWLEKREVESIKNYVAVVVSLAADPQNFFVCLLVTASQLES
jgi:hypothetical protein